MDSPLRNNLKRRREAARLTQQELADRVGVSRQTIHSLEAARATPSTAVALRLARALGAPLDALFWLEEDPDALPVHLYGADALDAPPSHAALGRVAGRWVAHAAPPHQRCAANALLDPATPGQPARARPLASPDALDQTLLIAGCAPALALIAQRLNERHAPANLRWVEATSARALHLLSDQAVHAAGLHLRDPDSGRYNRPLLQRAFPQDTLLLIHLASWDAGLLTRAAEPAPDLASPQLQVARRPEGAAARDLLTRTLRDAGHPHPEHPCGLPAPTHDDAARLVASGLVHAAVAPRAAALPFGDALRFTPLAAERFDLAFPGHHADDPRVLRLLDLLQSRALRLELERLGGYDLRETGHADLLSHEAA